MRTIWHYMKWGTCGALVIAVRVENYHYYFHAAQGHHSRMAMSHWLTFLSVHASCCCPITNPQLLYCFKSRCSINALRHSCVALVTQTNALHGMMASSDGIIFRVTGPLWGEYTGHPWIPLTKASDAELRYFFDVRLNKRLSKQSRCWRFETTWWSLWRRCNGVRM